MEKNTKSIVIIICIILLSCYILMAVRSLSSHKSAQLSSQPNSTEVSTTTPNVENVEQEKNDVESITSQEENAEIVTTESVKDDASEDSMICYQTYESDDLTLIAFDVYNQPILISSDYVSIALSLSNNKAYGVDEFSKIRTYDDEYIYYSLSKDNRQYNVPVFRIVEKTDDVLSLQPVRILREPVDIVGSRTEDYEYESRLTQHTYYEWYQVPIMDIDDYGEPIKLDKGEILYE